MPKLDTKALAGRLYARLDAAVPVRPLAVPGDWQPLPNQCHSNVNTWIETHPDHKAVRGWICADYLEAAVGWYKFFAHSIVETEAGELRDLTPNPHSQRYPFLSHDGTEEEFVTMVLENNIEFVMHQVVLR